MGAMKRSKSDGEDDDVADKRFKTTTSGEATAQTVACLGNGNPAFCTTCESSGMCLAAGQGTGDVTSQAELEKLIRAIASNKRRFKNCVIQSSRAIFAIEIILLPQVPRLRSTRPSATQLRKYDASEIYAFIK